jgi:biopolymer transport protein TolR
MGMSTGGNDPGKFTSLAEINVTPLVDVMLVLLIIFMVSSSVETVRVEQEMEKLLAEQEDFTEVEKAPQQQVPIELPKVNAEKVNLSEEKKLVLTMNDQLEFYIGDTAVAKCKEIVPEVVTPRERRENKPKKDETSGADEAFKQCLVVLEERLLENEKLKQDQELYLRADRTIDYGRVLAVMARIRKAGITKFGLVAEPDLEQ